MEKPHETSARKSINHSENSEISEIGLAISVITILITFYVISKAISNGSVFLWVLSAVLIFPSLLAVLTISLYIEQIKISEIKGVANQGLINICLRGSNRDFKVLVGSDVSPKIRNKLEVEISPPGQSLVLAAIVNSKVFGLTGMVVGPDGLAWKNSDGALIKATWSILSKSHVTKKLVNGITSKRIHFQFSGIGVFVVNPPFDYMDWLDSGDTGSIKFFQALIEYSKTVQAGRKPKEGNFNTGKGVNAISNTRYSSAYSSNVPRKNVILMNEFGREVNTEEKDDEAGKSKLIEDARREATRLAVEGAIFQVVTADYISGYHLKEIGWVSCLEESRRKAERALKRVAFDKYSDANCLVKLSSRPAYRKSDVDRRSDVAKGTDNKEIEKWEALACCAIPIDEVDISRKKWNQKVAIVDGSNVAYWNEGLEPSLEAIQSVIRVLMQEEIGVTLVFDANISYLLFQEYVAASEIKERLKCDVKVEVVESGTIADNRIIQLAEEECGIIISNDLFKDSIKARVIPKRRGFYLKEVKYCEVLPAR